MKEFDVEIKASWHNTSMEHSSFMEQLTHVWKHSIFSQINSSVFELRLLAKLLYRIATYFFFQVLTRKVIMSQSTSKSLRNRKQNSSSKKQSIL